MREHRSLFQPRQFEQLTAQRRIALEAMRTLAAFRPRLLGSLVDGDGALDHITLLLQADSVESVIHVLQDHHIPWRSDERTLHHASGQRLAHPALCFEAGGSSLALIIAPPHLRSDPPRDPLDGRRLALLDSAELAALLAAG